MILPEDDYKEIKEFEDFEIVFEPILASGETVVSMTITPSDTNSTVSITDDTVSGNYSAEFFLPDNSIEYELKSNNEVYVVDDFDQLPPANDITIRKMTAIDEITKTYTYDVVAVISLPAGGTRTAQKLYTNLVYGDYNVWAEQLRGYVDEGSS